MNARPQQIGKAHRVTSIVSVGAMAVALIGALIASPAAGSPLGRSFSEVGAAPGRASLTGCTDTFLLVEGDEGTIRSAVPQRFELGGELPVGAQLWSISSACDAIRVGDGPSRPGTLAFLGASVQPPDRQKGPEDINSYLFWAVTTDRRLQRALAAAGFPAFHERRTAQTASTGVLLGHSTLDVPWSGSPYRITAAITPAATHPHNHDAHWWVDGTEPREVLVHLAFSSENVADCALTTVAGSRLAMLLGGTERATPCFLQKGTASTIEF